MKQESFFFKNSFNPKEKRQREKIGQRTNGKNRKQIANDRPKSNHVNYDIKCKWFKCLN